MKSTSPAFAAFAVLIAASGFLAFATPAKAQSPSRSYLSRVRCAGVTVQRRDGVACAPPTASRGPDAPHSYQRWNDGSPALSGSSDPGGFPAYFRGFSSIHDLGR